MTNDTHNSNEFEDNDPATLPTNWGIDHDDNNYCGLCNTEIDMGEHCESCHEQIARRMARQ